MKSASLKRKSKRISTKQRCKTVKKMAEHTRKVRKDKRKNPGKYAKSKKDPGVPNDCPFKEQVLKEVEQARQQKQTDKEKRWEEAKCKRAEAKAKAMEEKRTNGIQGLVNDAQKRQIAHEAGQAFTNELKKDGISDRSAKAYYKEFQKVVEVADVILEVIDSRDPLGTRYFHLESGSLLFANVTLFFSWHKVQRSRVSSFEQRQKAGSCPQQG
jgi:nuclear GTP-binding protein